MRHAYPNSVNREVARLGVETDEAKADEQTIISKNAFNAAEGWSRDVTEDIATHFSNEKRGKLTQRICQEICPARAGNCDALAVFLPMPTDMVQHV